MERMENDELTVRVSLMSQPVRGRLTWTTGVMRERLVGPFLGFSGFNRMTDRSIASGMTGAEEAVTLHPRQHLLCAREWDLIERELGEADREGFRFSLHCQGDGAVGQVADLYERCRRDARGAACQPPCDHRHGAL